MGVISRLSSLALSGIGRLANNSDACRLETCEQIHPRADLLHCYLMFLLLLQGSMLSWVPGMLTKIPVFDLCWFFPFPVCLC
jgi:hypothetical protein